MVDIITTVLVLTFIAALFTRVWYTESTSDGIFLDFIHFIFQCNIKKYIFYIFSIHMTAPLLLFFCRAISAFFQNVCSMQLDETILKYGQGVWVFFFFFNQRPKEKINYIDINIRLCVDKASIFRGFKLYKLYAEKRGLWVCRLYFLVIHRDTVWLTIYPFYSLLYGRLWSVRLERNNKK